MTIASPVAGDAATMIGDLLRDFPEADTTPEARRAWHVRKAETLVTVGVTSSEEHDYAGAAEAFTLAAKAWQQVADACTAMSGPGGPVVSALEVVKPAEPADEVTIDLESIVNVEAIFGRALLDEVAAATTELAAMKGDLQPLMARLVATFKACEEATRRVYPVNGQVPGIVDSRIEVLDGLGVLLDAASGLTQLHDLATEIGIEEAVA